MADGIKISELPIAGLLGGTEDVPIVQDGDTKRTYASAFSRNCVPMTRTINGKALNYNITLDADDIGYDNETSGLTGDTTQEALDELADGVSTLEAEKQDVLTFDHAPTSGSSNPVTSGGVFDAITALLPTDTASGNPANFPDGYPAPIVDLAVNIDLTQGGTGLPSPDNIRLFTKWNQTTIYKSGADTSDPEETIISWNGIVSGGVVAGTVDVTTGLLTITHEDIGGQVENYATVTTVTDTYVQAMFTPMEQWYELNLAWSDRFSTDYASGVPCKMAFITSAGQKRLYFNVPRSVLGGITTEDLRTWLSQSHPAFILKLTTPKTRQLTPHELFTLMGENNIWASTGAVTVTYKANLPDYLAKKLPSTMSTLSMSRPAMTLGAVEPQSPVLDEGETASAEAEAEND